MLRCAFCLLFRYTLLNCIGQTKKKHQLSPLTGQEVEDAGSPSWRRHRQAEGSRVRRPPGRLSVLGDPRLVPTGQPCHAGVLHLQWALHQLHPGGYLAATSTHTGKFILPAANYVTGSKHLSPKYRTSTFPWWGTSENLQIKWLFFIVVLYNRC